MQISPVMDKDDKLLSLIAVFHDITELKKLERDPCGILAMYPMKLKTPLTAAIKGFIEALKNICQR